MKVLRWMITSQQIYDKIFYYWKKLNKHIKQIKIENNKMKKLLRYVLQQHGILKRLM